MILKRIPVGQLLANCYLFGDADTKDIVVIDPGDEAERIISYINDKGLTVKHIAITHRHFDHVGAVAALEKVYNAPVVEKNFSVGKHDFQIIKTPGHSPDGVCYKTGKIIFTGDTLFYGTVGRYDFEGGDYGKLVESVNMLLEFSDDTIIYPGHGMSTTIGKEKLNNPFATIKGDK